MTSSVDDCTQCGFVYPHHQVPGIIAELRALGPRYADRLRSALEAGSDDALRTRPSPEVWSALEYACHLRDILLAQRERMFLALVEERPSFAPVYPDRRVVLARYLEENPADTGREIELAADLISRSFAGLSEQDWSRRCLYNFPEPAERNLTWLAQHTLHEGEHHLMDFDHSLGAVGHKPGPLTAGDPGHWIRELVLDCEDPWALARFWAGLLGGVPEEWYPGWVTIEPPPHGQRLSFQASRPSGDLPAAGPPRMHFDVWTSDLEAADRQVSAAGGHVVATHISPRPGPNGEAVPWRVYLDPAGHPFCLVVR
jgi:hypothetical protein